jgi:hypothetical protein
LDPLVISLFKEKDSQLSLDQTTSLDTLVDMLHDSDVSESPFHGLDKFKSNGLMLLDQFKHIFLPSSPVHKLKDASVDDGSCSLVLLESLSALETSIVSLDVDNLLCDESVLGLIHQGSDFFFQEHFGDTELPHLA